MKKLFVFLMVCAIALCLPFAAFADGEYSTAGELYQSWDTGERSGEPFVSFYPEGVCGVWSTDGGMDNLTIAVTDDEAGEKAKKAILAAVANDDTLSFTTQDYTHAELTAAANEIARYLQDHNGEESGAAGFGVHEKENRVCVDIIMTKPGAEDFVRWCYETFGDKVMFESVDGYVVPSAGEMGLDEPGGGESGGMGGAVTALAALVLIVGAVLIAKKRLSSLRKAGGKGKE